jgi:hypothetical protein
MKMTSPDSLQRLRCYDDDMVDPLGSFNVAAGYLILSLHVFFFLSVLHSLFPYACLKYVLFILSTCVYVIMLNNF